MPLGCSVAEAGRSGNDELVDDLPQDGSDSGCVLCGCLPHDRMWMIIQGIGRAEGAARVASSRIRSGLQ